MISPAKDAPVITLRISTNEKATAPERFGAIIMETERHPERWDVVADGEAEVDLVFSLIHPYRRDLGVELKRPRDLIGSLQGHLGEQRRNCPYPLRIAVLGSMGDVLRALPEVTTNGWQNPRDRVKAEAQIRRDISSLRASGVEVDFGVSPMDFKTWNHHSDDAERDALAANIFQILHDARATLLGDTALRMPKCESWQEYCLRGLIGVGVERARGIQDKGIYVTLKKKRKTPMTESFPSVEIECGVIEEDLMEVEKIGPKTAKKIMEAVR